ncbi:MAG: hypothetical protein NTV98_02555, partial [Candidatus Roizmanbacteria bacterium]|nr:hypothetical protein [Candidatus Roizmanbacteria bacterium]
RLMELGWGKRRIAIFYWLITCLLGIASLFLNGIGKLIAIVLIALLLGLFFMFVDKQNKNRS